MRRGELKFTPEEAEAIREAERYAGYAPPPPTGVGPGTLVAGLLGGVLNGVEAFGHAVDQFFRALFISAAVVVAILVVVLILSHGFESRPRETTNQVQITGNQPELGAAAPWRHKGIPYKEYMARRYIPVYTVTPDGSMRKIKYTRPALREREENPQPRAAPNDPTADTEVVEARADDPELAKALMNSPWVKSQADEEMPLYAEARWDAPVRVSVEPGSTYFFRDTGRPCDRAGKLTWKSAHDERLISGFVCTEALQ